MQLRHFYDLALYNSYDGVTGTGALWRQAFGVSVTIRRRAIVRVFKHAPDYGLEDGSGIRSISLLEGWSDKRRCLIGFIEGRP